MAEKAKSTVSADENYQTVLATLTEDIEPSPSRSIAITACHNLGAELTRLREIQKQDMLGVLELRAERDRLRADLAREKEHFHQHDQENARLREENESLAATQADTLRESAGLHKQIQELVTQREDALAKRDKLREDIESLRYALGSVQYERLRLEGAVLKGAE